MPLVRRCIACGSSEEDVEKLHNFPVNNERSRIWQLSMGMKYAPGVNMKNYSICNQHFSPGCYINILTRRLRHDAVPTLLPCILDSPQVPLTAIESISSRNIDETVQVDDSPIASCSRQQIQELPGTSTAVEPGKVASTHRPIFRGIAGVSRATATPRKQHLMRLIESKEVHIRSLKRLCKKRAAHIKDLCDLEDSSVVRNLFKSLSNKAADFLISQLRCAKRKPHGRRWTVQEKVIALSLLKRSPRCYNLLRKIVALPSKNTLLMMLQKVPFTSGINSHIFTHISESIKDGEGKYCALVLDEMDIKEHLQYDAHLDKIIGFEELDGVDNSKKFANKALVFLLQGLVHNWKQPVAYYFSHGACSPEILKHCLTNVFRASQELANTICLSTICDMGSTNVRALKELGSSAHKPSIVIDGKEVFTMFDPPHLLKCTASLFRKHNILVPVTIGGTSQTMEARFADIIKAVQIDQQSPLIFRALHKIKSSHLKPKMQYAMKVSIAAHTMSHTVAAYIYTLLSRGELEQRSLGSATFVKQVDTLFDSFNGSRASAPEGKELRCCVTDKSAHHVYWREAFDMVRSWQFRRYTKKGKLRQGKPPSQVGWLTSLNAIQKIWLALYSKGVKSLRPRALNQDALENLFGAVRGGCGSGDNPTAVQFAASLKTQILNGLTRQKIVGSNCEEDDSDFLSNLTQFLHVDGKDIPEPATPMAATTLLPPNIADSIAKAVAEGATTTLSTAYVSGFIAKKLLETYTCMDCQNNLMSTSQDSHNLFITFKEWSTDSEHLKYPAESLVVAVGQAVTILEQTLEEYCNKPQISAICTESMKNGVDFSWITCKKHQEFVSKEVIRAVWKIGIPWWCKRKSEENKQMHKDIRATKRKLKTFKH